MTNAERFLDAYAVIERRMREIIRETRYTSFSQLLHNCASRNQIIAMNQQSLREYNELRNAIVHQRGTENEIIAEPADSVTQDIERIARLLCMDENVMNYVTKPVRVVSLQEDIMDAYALMKRLGTSKIPVYEDNLFKGVLTIEMIAKWAVEDNKQAKTVEEILSSSGEERVLFLKKSARVRTVIKAFETSLDHGSVLSAVIVSERGSKNARPLGIITLADLPRILSTMI